MIIASTPSWNFQRLIAYRLEGDMALAAMKASGEVEEKKYLFYLNDQNSAGVVRVASFSAGWLLTKQWMRKDEA